jgi:pimeloyl-ACP methyl ester carboxylesterase
MSFVQGATVALVHGAWADGSCWQDIILPLQREGLDVTCAQIPLTSLSDDIAALERTLERMNGPILVVGHAYGGAVIAGPRNGRVRGLVYVAALAPAEGETVGDVFYRAKPHPEAPQVQPDAHGFVWMPEGGFARAVAHTAPKDRTAILETVQRPIALKCIQETAPLPSWKAKPTWYLLAEQDRMIPPETQRFMAQRMGAKVRAYDVDHSPMYTASDAVVGVILEAAREALT